MKDRVGVKHILGVALGLTVPAMGALIPEGDLVTFPSTGPVVREVDRGYTQLALEPLSPPIFTNLALVRFDAEGNRMAATVLTGLFGGDTKLEITEMEIRPQFDGGSVAWWREHERVQGPCTNLCFIVEQFRCSLDGVVQTVPISTNGPLTGAPAEGHCGLFAGATTNGTGVSLVRVCPMGGADFLETSAGTNRVFRVILVTRPDEVGCVLWEQGTSTYVRQFRYPGGAGGTFEWTGDSQALALGATVTATGAAFLSNGNLVIVGLSNGTTVVAQRWDGASLSAAAPVSDVGQFPFLPGPASVASGRDGDFVAVWSDLFAEGPGGGPIAHRVRYFTNMGAAADSVFLGVTNRWYPRVHRFGTNQFFVGAGSSGQTFRRAEAGSTVGGPTLLEWTLRLRRPREGAAFRSKKGVAIRGTFEGIELPRGSEIGVEWALGATNGTSAPTWQAIATVSKVSKKGKARFRERGAGRGETFEAGLALWLRGTTNDASQSATRTFVQPLTPR